MPMPPLCPFGMAAIILPNCKAPVLAALVALRSERTKTSARAARCMYGRAGDISYQFAQIIYTNQELKITEIRIH